MFDWKDYLVFAKSLQTQGEPALRTAVSRSYYAAFCYARNYARDQQQFSPSYSSSDHFNLRDHFRRAGKYEISGKLQRLRQWRNDCDYEDTVQNISSIVESAIKSAEGIIDTLQ